MIFVSLFNSLKTSSKFSFVQSSCHFCVFSAYHKVVFLFSPHLIYVLKNSLSNSEIIHLGIVFSLDIEMRFQFITKLHQYLKVKYNEEVMLSKRGF